MSELFLKLKENGLSVLHRHRDPQISLKREIPISIQSLSKEQYVRILKFIDDQEIYLGTYEILPIYTHASYEELRNFKRDNSCAITVILFKKDLSTKEIFEMKEMMEKIATRISHRINMIIQLENAA